MTTFRFSMACTRSTVFIRTLDLLQHLEGIGEAMSGVTPQRLYDFTKNATRET